MQLLLCNDDGIDAPGLLALEAALAELGEVHVVAPSAERSAQSHALTMHKPLRVRAAGPRRWAVSGTPADCVYLAVQSLLTARPDVVVSGINRGANLGNDTYYSGTVAAAREGCLQGLRGVAVSLARGPEAEDYGAASLLAQRVVRRVLAGGLSEGVLLNVNVPRGLVRGLHACPLGRLTYTPGVEHRTDPRGRSYYWIGGEPVPRHDAGTDGDLLLEGWATVTPVDIWPTHTPSLELLRDWTDR